jgi:hypothetical protein
VSGRRVHAWVIIQDAQGRQVFGLNSCTSAELTLKGIPARFGDYVVKITVDECPPWYVEIPGFLVYAACRNWVQLHCRNIRTRLRARAILRKRRNPFYAETTSPCNSKSDADSDAS